MRDWKRLVRHYRVFKPDTTLISPRLATRLSRVVSTPIRSTLRSSRTSLSSTPSNFRRSFVFESSDLRRSLCQSRLKRADAVRRSRFFRARVRGSSGSRPAHNRKFKRDC